MQNRGSTPFLTLGIPEFTMFPSLAVQGWGRAGVTAVVKDRTGPSEVQGANRLTVCSTGSHVWPSTQISGKVDSLSIQKMSLFSGISAMYSIFSWFLVLPREYLGPDDTGISHLDICQLTEFSHMDKFTHGQIRTLCQKFHSEMACMSKIYTHKK